MCEPEVEDAYRESGALVHTLALRSLGSVEEAEDIVRRVFASAAASGALDSRELLHEAADRITGDLERRVRAKLVALDDAPTDGEAVTDASAVLAEADRILIAAALDGLEEDRRIVLQRALVEGEPRFELARCLEMPEDDLEVLLRDSLLALWTGPRPGEGHVPVESLASRALGIRIADGGREHIAQCRECKTAWRSLNDLVGAVTRMRVTGAVVPPRDGLWDEVRDAVDAGAPVEVDWRAQARDDAARAQRRRTMVMGVAIVASSLLVALAVALGQAFMQDDRAAIASATLEDPRSGADAGQVWIEETSDGDQVLVIDGVYREYPDAYLEAWLVSGEVPPVSLGQVTSAHHEVALPAGLPSAVGARIEISREPWDGDPARTGDVIAAGDLD
ncbi:anti-sigma factor domain-containing protein [Demequina gelatinilytica]|uniref:anti-sigma factor domain-containing protein n=1 Tax=Demequina gelatinilytica TaxID=1638980 RepID=UPI000782E8CB|nr:anti-sigma factor [Demequina gelatinilytica]